MTTRLLSSDQTLHTWLLCQYQERIEHKESEEVKQQRCASLVFYQSLYFVDQVSSHHHDLGDIVSLCHFWKENIIVTYEENSIHNGPNNIYYLVFYCVIKPFIHHIIVTGWLCGIWLLAFSIPSVAIVVAMVITRVYHILSYHWRTWWCLWSPYYFLGWCLYTSPQAPEQRREHSAQRMCAGQPRLFPTRKIHHHTPFLSRK